MQDHANDPSGASRTDRGEHASGRGHADPSGAATTPDGGRVGGALSAIPRVAAGGAIVARRAPAAPPGQAASGSQRTAPPSTWPVARPPQPAPGVRPPPKVDARTGGQSRPATGPLPLKVDARTDGGSDDYERMPEPGPRRPMAPIRPGSPKAAALARQATPIPSAERLQAVREAKRRKLGFGKDNGDGTVAEPTRAAKTVEAYKAKGEQLLRRYRRERGVPDDIDQFDPLGFAVWLLSLRVGLKPSSWRLYKQSGLMALGGFPDERAAEAVAMIDGDSPQEVEMGTGEPVDDTGSDRLTSARKAKYVKYEDYLRIESYLRTARRSDHAVVLQDWLRAGIATGLRPVEWRATEVASVQDPTHRNGKRTFLFVLNAKATNGRANGVVRTIDISDFGEVAQQIVRRMSGAGLRAFEEGRFREFQSHCAQILYQACRKLWPRRKTHYALYSCRHQFIANAKGVGLSNAEVSALAGHMVDETAARNYGRQRTAWFPDKVVDRARGVPEEIASVTKRLHLWEERMALLDIVRNGVRSDDTVQAAGLLGMAPTPPIPAPVP